MAVFGIESKIELSFLKFIKDTQERAETKMTFFNLDIARLHNYSKNTQLLIFKFKPTLPPIYVGAVIPFILSLVFLKLWLLIVALVWFYFIGFFWTHYFYAAMLKYAIKKHNIKLKIKILTGDKLLERVVDYVAN